MRYLRQNTAVTITVGPFIDVADSITAEIALTATNEKLTFVVDTVTGSPPTPTPTLVIDTMATASGGSNDFVHITNDDAGYYTLELTAAQTNYVGEAHLSIQYPTDHLPVFHTFRILPANLYDAWIGQEYQFVNVKQINSATVVGDGNATPWDGA